MESRKGLANDRRATNWATESQLTIVLDIKDHKVTEISPHFSFLRISDVQHKNGKIDFSNNLIVEMKKKMTFQGVSKYKQL